LPTFVSLKGKDGPCPKPDYSLVVQEIRRTVVHLAERRNPRIIAWSFWRGAQVSAWQSLPKRNAHR
jgi:hypothetical protein